MLDTMPRRKRADAEPTETVSFRLPTALLERLRKIAYEEDRNLTAQVTRVLREWLDDHAADGGNTQLRSRQ